MFRERDLLRELDHPNIIKQEFTFQDDQNVYFVLEYASNGCLSKLINNCPKIPKDLVVFYIAELVNIFEYLRMHNIIHRDIKPDNILIDEDFHLKLVHFLL